MTTARITYASRTETYNLDITRVFKLVTEIKKYMDNAITQAQNDNPGSITPGANLEENGRTLALYTDAVNQPGILTPFNLAQLVMSEDDFELTLTVNEHESVAIPSEDLHHIASKYVLE